MRGPHTRIGLALACLWLTTAIGLAADAAETPTSTIGDYQPKGFLSDYSKLKPDAEGSDVLRYRDPTVDFWRYKKLAIDPIKIWIKEDADYKGIDPNELKALTDYFYEAIVKAVGDAYPIVTEPGPDVLHLRIAVTDLVPNKPEASVVTLVVPFLWLGDAGTGVAEGHAGSTMFVGEATVEMEGLDSETGRQRAAYIETRIGKKYNWTEGVEKGVKDYVKAYATWAYTKQAFDYWAQLIRQRLDEVHGRTPKEDSAIADRAPGPSHNDEWP